MGAALADAVRGQPAQSAEYISHPMILIPAHAKVNLCLAVRGSRPDGFHDIDSVALRIDWHDLVGLRLEPSAATRVRLRVTGEDGMAPPGDTNLAARAAQAVAAMAGPFDIDVWLDKRVPGAAGLGSGSGDAAAVLRGCFALLAAGGSWSTSAPFHDGATMRQLASSLGSDVPMLLVGARSGCGEGRAPLHGRGRDGAPPRRRRGRGQQHRGDLRGGEVVRLRGRIESGRGCRCAGGRCATR